MGVKGIGTIGLPIFKWSNTEVSLGSHSVTLDGCTEKKRYLNACSEHTLSIRDMLNMSWNHKLRNARR